MNTPINKHGALPMANTLSHHAQAASTFLRSVMFQPFSIYITGGSKPKLHPLIGDRIEQCQKWGKPRDKRKPYTFEMLATFHTQVLTAMAADPRLFLDVQHLIFNTQCLGIFTGSRVSEYAQSRGSASKISRVPLADSAKTTKPLAIALVAQDFVFLLKSGTIIPHKELSLNPSAARQLQITFPYDKSCRNHTVRKYGPGDKWLCPISAAINIIHRARTLRIPSADPVCAYRPANSSQHRFLRDTQVTDTMHRICINTYPDPTHFLWLNLHLHRFASHSNRVTAAVALNQAGLPIDDIAQQLRWKLESVAFYLREMSQDIGVLEPKGHTPSAITPQSINTKLVSFL
jgi:hypothetical protein